MLKHIFCALGILTSSIYAGIVKEPFTTLSIDDIKQGSAIDGSLNFSVILKLNVGDRIEFILQTGKKILCIVKDITILETEKQIKIFGDTLNVEDGGFGFIFTNKGDIAGAIVLRKEKLTYVVKPNPIKSGYIFSHEYQQIPSIN
jgi:hypothetical protein